MNGVNDSDLNSYNMNQRSGTLPNVMPQGIPSSAYGPYVPGVPQYMPGTSPGYAPPNLNYSIPGYNVNTSMSGRGNPSFGTGMGGLGGMFPYGPGINAPAVMAQNTINMANEIDVYQPELQRNQYLMEREEEKKEMKKNTELIREGLNRGGQESREERQRKRLLRFRGGNLYRPPIEVYVPRSEYFYERDRYFIEQLLMQPLKTNGILGTKLVDDFDKQALFQEEEVFHPVSHYIPDDEEEYFEKAVKDGIYLDYIKKLIYSFNIQKIEQRAAREGKKDWFRQNGDLRLDNDIFSDVITKPTDISLTANDKFNMFYGNSAFSGRNSDSKLKVFKLKIIISKIIFTYHPVFTEEEILCSEVKELHRDFYQHMNSLNIPYLKDKITTITQKMGEYSKIKVPTETMNIEMKNMRIFLNEATDFLIEEKKILNEKANKLYNKWLDLKRLRESQKYQSTRTKLNVIRFNANNENPNIFDYAFILTNYDVSADPTIVPKTELDRRERVKTYNCVLKFYINGVFAFETKPNNFNWPLFEVEFNNQFILNLYTRPTKMEVEIYINKVLVNKFEAEPPGIFAKTITSSSPLFEEIEFGKEKEKEKEKKKDEPDVKLVEQQPEENEQLINRKEEERQKKEAEEKRKEEEMKRQRVEGRIIIKTEWEGRAPELPPTKIEDKLELVNKQIEFKEAIRKYNSFDYPFDVNDPRNVAFVEEMKKGRLELMLKFLYKEYLLNFNDVLSTRHYLLLKRLEKKSLENVTFPILESQIEKDEKTQELLAKLRKEDSQERKFLTPEEEFEAKIRDGLKEINKIAPKDMKTNKEFTDVIRQKIKVMKKDKTQIYQYNYFQVISEAEIYDDPVLLLKEFFIRVFSRARKLAPLKIKPPPVKVEKTEKLKVNIHVVKGYNVPIRKEALPSNVIDHLKLESVGLKTSTLRNVLINNSRMMNQMNNNPELGSRNNSALFNPGAATLNQSINVDMMNQMNRSGTMGNNPNLANTMFNPANPNMPPFYRRPAFDSRGVETIAKIQQLSMFEKKVNSFIEVKIVYYDQVAVFRTDSVDSIHPDYNHQIEFEIKPKKGAKYFTREELAQCPGAFYFTLYDEVRRDSLEKGKDANTYIQRFEKKYLGSFTIPFATVFQNASILDTICKVDIPKAVFGYYSDTSSIFDVSDTLKNDEKKPDPPSRSQSSLLNTVPKYGNVGEGDVLEEIPKIVNPFVNTYVSLYITLDPVPNFTKNDELDYVPGFEDSIFLINGTKWLKKMKEKSLLKNRNIRLFAENFDGYSVFMPRFLKAEGQRPHNMIFTVNDENGIEKVSRYVALIPFIEDNQAFDDLEEMPDCWCTDNEFLTLGFGDYEEHAVLLCNYFNYVDQQQKTGCVSYLALGDAHPEGMTIYVMRISQDNKQVEFWNAKTGDCFYFDKTIEENKFLCLTVSKTFKYTKANSNTICQLKSVGAIITFDNVYVNIQKESDPGLMDFDLKNTTNWTPFLTEESKRKYFPEGIKTVQKDIIYAEPSEEERDALKAAIREYLKAEIEKVRADIKNDNVPLRTNWENTANDKIERILEQYEMKCFNAKKSGIIIDSQQTKEQIHEQRKAEKKELLDNFISYEREIQDQFVGATEVYGFPINVSFVTMEGIWEQVKLTNVHLIASENSELSLTVHVNPLPGNVNSVWIFLAILKKANF